MNDYLLFELCDVTASFAILIVLFFIYRRGMAIRLGFIIVFSANIGSQLAFFWDILGLPL